MMRAGEESVNGNIGGRGEEPGESRRRYMIVILPIADGEAQKKSRAHESPA